MKRFHVHVAVADIEQSVQFYTTFFNADPTVKKDDYAKWMLDDPRINFAISKRGTKQGLDHLGIQVEDEKSLKEISDRLKDAKHKILEQEKTKCCYAESDKTWVHDPQGIAWESFVTIGEATTYGEDVQLTHETVHHKELAMKIQVFDPPMCCSTGICGPGVDPKLVSFTADLDWLKRQGVEVERYNLSQQTEAFVSNSTVTDALKQYGNECLPLILLDGKIVSKSEYPTREKLAALVGLEAPKAGLKVTVEQVPSANSNCCSAPTTKESCCDESSDKEKSTKSSCC